MGEGNPQNASASAFVRVVYSFKRGTRGYNKLSVSLDRRDIEGLLARLNEHLVGFQAVVPEKLSDQLVNLRQKFVIPNIEIDDDLFMFMISTDKTMATLLRFVEQEKPWTLKKQISFGVYLLGNITLAFKPSTVESAARVVPTERGFPLHLQGQQDHRRDSDHAVN